MNTPLRKEKVMDPHCKQEEVMDSKGIHNKVMTGFSTQTGIEGVSAKLEPTE